MSASLSPSRTATDASSGRGPVRAGLAGATRPKEGQQGQPTRGPRRRPAVAPAVLVGLLLAAVCAGPATAAVDPFYDNLLREGRLAFDAGDWATAAARLRLACFGLLDEPQLLTEALARLALAQNRSGDVGGFRQTIQRIVEVDDRFSTYGPDTVPAELRSELEAAIVGEIPAEFLAASTTFRHLGAKRAQPDEDLAELPPKRRRSALEERMAVDPENFRWPLLLAETELDLGNLAAAVKAASDALDRDPGNQNALCARGLARAGLDQCAPAARDLETCRKVYSDSAYSLALLQCQIDLGRPDDARRLLATLPEDIRAERSVRRLERRLPEAPAVAPGPTTPPPEPAMASTATNELSPADLATLEDARDLLNSARSLDTLARALELARTVADDHPDHPGAQRLVGEIAYRASRWEQAVTYFERGDVPGMDEPRLLFYLAVAYWESGRRGDAGEVLRRALPSLQRSAYVESYVQKILGGEG